MAERWPARIAAGAIEVASLGDTFGAAVQRFGESNEQLVARLHAIEAALDQSLTRSDEQLAYYVAQAREVIDLSVLSQKQIIGELQQLAEAQVLDEHGESLQGGNDVHRTQECPGER